MSWFADLAGKAENLLTNLDEQTGVALRNQNVMSKQKKQVHINSEQNNQKKRPTVKSPRTLSPRRSRETGPGRVPTKAPQSKITLNKSKQNKCPLKEADDTADSYGYKPRRFSLPVELGDMSYQAWVNNFESLEAANSKLTNELNITEKEIKELYSRLRNSEDELKKERKKIENMVEQNQRVNSEKLTLIKRLAQLEHKIQEMPRKESHKYDQTETSLLKAQKKELEELIELYINKDKENVILINKTENDLRHAQSTINNLLSEKSKEKNECMRIEKEWEAYKVRVKNMLANKDKEIQALQQGINLTEDTKLLVDQIDNLKQERELLSDVVSRVRSECDDMKTYMRTLESEQSATKLVVTALREALKEERTLKTKAEAACKDMAKNMKCIQIETGETIATLRAALLEKGSEIEIQHSTTGSTVPTINSSALNVADYGSKTDRSEDAEKINYLTKKLVQRQSQIDHLRAHNNMLKIQVGKLESKCKVEPQSQSLGHSVVAVQDGGHRQRKSHHSSFTAKVSSWFSFLVRSHPLCRVFVVMYMICLHIWVFTVILTSTPDNNKMSFTYLSRQ